MTADPSGHPDVEALDAYLDSLPGAPPTAAVGEHVAGCADCAETLDALRRVRADLASLGPVEMPAGVAERISAALRAESGSSSLPDHHGLRRVGTARRRQAGSRGPAGRDGGAGGGPAGRRGTAAPATAAGRRRPGRGAAPRVAGRGGWLAGVTLAAIALLAGGLVLVHRDGGGQSATSAVAGRAPSAGASSSGSTSSGSNSAGSGADQAAPRAAAPEAVPSYDRTTVTRLAAGVPQHAPFAANRTSGTSALAECLQRLAGGGGEVALVRQIAFEGVPAVGAVLRTAGAGLRVVVVDPACSAADAARSVRYSTGIAG